MKKWVVVDVFSEIVQQVSDVLTPQLQVVNGLITGVHYEHGHPKEIIETLAQKDKSQAGRFDKYPVVALFQDFPERNGEETGIQSEAVLHMIIASATKPDYKARDRYEYNFRPVLYPIYVELMRQIYLHRAFMVKGPDQIRHTKIDRLYWGREGLWGNKGNIFNDWIDCIEIRDMRLRINQKLC